MRNEPAAIVRFKADPNKIRVGVRRHLCGDGYRCYLLTLTEREGERSPVTLYARDLQIGLEILLDRALERDFPVDIGMERAYYHPWKLQGEGS